MAENVPRHPRRGGGPGGVTGGERPAGEVQRASRWLNWDCGERVPRELAEEIGQLLSAPGMAPAYTVPRRTFVGGKEIRHCGWYPDRTTRLFHRSKARFSSALAPARG